MSTEVSASHSLCHDLARNHLFLGSRGVSDLGEGRVLIGFKLFLLVVLDVKRLSGWGVLSVGERGSEKLPPIATFVISRSINQVIALVRHSWSFGGSLASKQRPSCGYVFKGDRRDDVRADRFGRATDRCGSSLWTGPGGFGLARLIGRAVAPSAGLSVDGVVAASAVDSGASVSSSAVSNFEASQSVSSRIIAQATTPSLRANAMPAFLRRLGLPP